MAPDKIREQIINMFRAVDKPADGVIHQQAKVLGLEPSVLEENIYLLLSDILRGRPNEIVGKHNERPDSDFDAGELTAGIKIEYEHTNDAAIAKAIAKDHLAEISDYYTRLAKMEAEAGITDAVKSFKQNVKDALGEGCV